MTNTVKIPSSGTLGDLAKIFGTQKELTELQEYFDVGVSKFGFDVTFRNGRKNDGLAIQTLAYIAPCFKYGGDGEAIPDVYVGMAEDRLWVEAKAANWRKKHWTVSASKFFAKNSGTAKLEEMKALGPEAVRELLHPHYRKNDYYLLTETTIENAWYKDLESTRYIIIPTEVLIEALEPELHNKKPYTRVLADNLKAIAANHPDIEVKNEK